MAEVFIFKQIIAKNYNNKCIIGKMMQLDTEGQGETNFHYRVHMFVGLITAELPTAIVRKTNFDFEL